MTTALDQAVSYTSIDRDLMKRVASVRGLVRGRMLFTASFGLEDQAIAHAIFTQALEIEVVTLDTGRLFPETYELWAQTERRYGPVHRGLLSRSHQRRITRCPPGH